jgi:hypothetical protein
VIAAITSCTNTSNPALMIGAGLLAKKAVEKGLSAAPWVKTSLAPGSKVVTDYLERAGLTPYLDQLGFNLVGYGCTTCIGNSGPLGEDVAHAVAEHDMIVAAVLSGNRNFEGRIHPQVRANYLASPPLVVAYALAGRMDIDLTTEPLGRTATGEDVYLRDVWPTQRGEIDAAMARRRLKEMFRTRYADVFNGDARWSSMHVPAGERYAWDEKSEYVKRPPYFDGMPKAAGAARDISGARVLAVLGDSVTTDHISPAGNIARSSPAAQVPDEQRRRSGRLQLLRRAARQSRGDGARHVRQHPAAQLARARRRRRRDALPADRRADVDLRRVRALPRRRHAAHRAGRQGIRLGFVARLGGEGPVSAGHQAAIAESFERIHRSNLIGMGILPLQYADGATRESLGLTGEETFAIEGVAAGLEPGMTVTVTASGDATAARRRSTRWCASTRPTKPSTTATAGSCSTSCANSRPRKRAMIPASRRAPLVRRSGPLRVDRRARDARHAARPRARRRRSRRRAVLRRRSARAAVEAERSRRDAAPLVAMDLVAIRATLRRRDGNKIHDWEMSLPVWIVDEIIVPGARRRRTRAHHLRGVADLGRGDRIDRVTRERGLRGAITLMWNANNTYGFEKIHWPTLTRAAAVTAVSKYMKFELVAAGACTRW